jgi:4-amino-4-deoxy-L-arabinose transferase-like glycosyltransferase
MKRVTLTGLAWWFIVLGVLSARLVTLGLYPIMDSSEARYAEIARKMADLGDWIILWYDHGVPFWGKPPLSSWLTAISFRLFGVSEFAARLPHLLCALLVVWLVWDWGARRDRQQAGLAIGLLVSSTLFFVASGAVMTDMSLALGTTLAMRGFWLGLFGDARERRRERWLFFLGLIIGLLAKGPVVLALVGMSLGLWVLATGSGASVWRGLPWGRGILLVAAGTTPWYMLAEQYTPGFLEYFLVGEHWHRFVTPGWIGDRYGSAHAYFYGSIWLFAIIATFPWSLLLPVIAVSRWWMRKPSSPPGHTDRPWQLYLLCWGLSPCLFFTVAGNILWTYVLPGLPALALWASSYLSRPLAELTRWRFRLAAMLALVPSLFLLLVLHPRAIEQSQLWSAKALVERYHSMSGARAPLVFVGKRPYSATFYSQGRAEVAADFETLAGRLRQEAIFVALPGSAASHLPIDLKGQLTLLAQFGDYWLYCGEPDRPALSARPRTQPQDPEQHLSPLSPEQFSLCRQDTAAEERS